MFITKKLYWVERDWFDPESKKTYGDMAFYFQDSTDTRTTDMNDLKERVIGFIPNDMNDWKENIQSGIFPVYTIFSADFEQDCDKEDDFDELFAMCLDDTRKMEYTVAYCSEESGREKGINADYYADTNDYLND